MKINYTICSVIALALLGVCGVVHSQDDAVKMVLDILKGDDQDMQSVAITMVKDMPGEQVTKALAAELPNLSAKTQVQLLSALGDRGDTAARRGHTTPAGRWRTAPARGARGRSQDAGRRSGFRRAAVDRSRAPDLRRAPPRAPYPDSP